MDRYRVLSLDGGGIRGVLSAVILERLEAAHPFLEKIDLVAGTSTGAILALGIASGYKPEEIREVYENRGQEVFADTLLDDLVDVGKLAGADYSNENLKAVLQGIFGRKTLNDLLPKHVLIATFDLDNQAAEPGHRSWKPKFFHNFPGPDSDGQERVVDVAVRSSAAPTYFPLYQGYVDGGVVANNPSVCALAQALHPETGNQPIGRIALLSLGTGRSPRYLPQLDADWGIAQWARHLVDLMLEGSVGTADYQCRQILADRYRRVNPILPTPIELDQIDRIEELKAIAEGIDLSETVDWLRRHFEHHPPAILGAEGLISK